MHASRQAVPWQPSQPQPQGPSHPSGPPAGQLIWRSLLGSLTHAADSLRSGVARAVHKLACLGPAATGGPQGGGGRGAGGGRWEGWLPSEGWDTCAALSHCAALCCVETAACSLMQSHAVSCSLMQSHAVSCRSCKHEHGGRLAAGADLAASARSSAVSLVRLATSVAVRGS